MTSRANDKKISPCPFSKRGELAVEREEAPKNSFVPSCILPPLKKGDREGFESFTNCSGQVLRGEFSVVEGKFSRHLIR
jgi:hypothetical protein